MLEPMDTARLASLVETSRLVASSRSRLAKIAALAAFLQTLAAEEIEIAVDWLTGTCRRERSASVIAA